MFSVVDLPPLFTSLTITSSHVKLDKPIQWFDGAKLSIRKTYLSFKGTTPTVNKKLALLETTLNNIFKELPLETYNVYDFCNILQGSDEFMLIGNKTILNRFSLFAMLTDTYLDNHIIVNNNADDDILFVKENNLGIFDLETYKITKNTLTVKCAIGIYSNIVSRVRLTDLA